MSVNTKKSLSPQLRKLTVVVPIATIVVVLGLALYTYSASSQSCEDVISTSKKMIAEKKYRQSYTFLTSKSAVCQDSSRVTLGSVQYQRYLAISAYKVGDKKTSRATAKAALNDYKKLSSDDKTRMGDSFTFVSSMFTIRDNVEGLET